MILTDAHPHPTLLLPMQQHPAFVNALNSMGREAASHTLRVGGKRVGHAAVISRRLPLFGRIGMVSHGPVWSASASFDERVRAFKALAQHGIRIMNSVKGDDAALAAAGFRLIATPATVAQVDIQTDVKRQRQRMHSKWRNRLLKAESNGITWRCFPFDGDETHWLLAEEARQQRSKRYRGLPPALSAAWVRANHGNARLFVAYDGRTRIAAMLFLRHGKVATYQIGWSGHLGRETNAHNLLLSQAISMMAERGIKRLDLGTLDTSHAPGLARFKLGCGAKPVELGGTWINLRTPRN